MTERISDEQIALELQAIRSSHAGDMSMAERALLQVCADLDKARAYMAMAQAGIEATIKERDTANDMLRAVRAILHRCEHDAMHTKYTSMGIAQALREVLRMKPEEVS